jgi:hypothetical protein
MGMNTGCSRSEQETAINLTKVSAALDWRNSPRLSSTPEVRELHNCLASPRVELSKHVVTTWHNPVASTPVTGPPSNVPALIKRVASSRSILGAGVLSYGYSYPLQRRRINLPVP